MPRRQTPKSGETAHITIRCNNAEYYLNPIKNYRIIAGWLNCFPLLFQVSIHHYVIMANHIHLLLTPTFDNLGDAMCYLLTNISKILGKDLGRKNHIFGSRYYPTIINNPRYLENVIRYIYQNPVRANIVDSIFAYPYSSLSYYINGEITHVFIGPLFEYDISSNIKWINEINKELLEFDLKTIRESMRRRIFRYSRDQILDTRKNPCSLII